MPPPILRRSSILAHPGRLSQIVATDVVIRGDFDPPPDSSLSRPSAGLPIPAERPSKSTSRLCLMVARTVRKRSSGPNSVRSTSSICSMIRPSNDKGAPALAWQTASAPADPRTNIIPRPRVRTKYNSPVAPLRSKQPGNPADDDAQWQAVHCMADGFDFPGYSHVKYSSGYSSTI
jgi:hypothetical protein